MARILDGIGNSHVPTIGVAYDKGMCNDPDWAPLFAGYEPMKPGWRKAARCARRLL